MKFHIWIVIKNIQVNLLVALKNQIYKHIGDFEKRNIDNGLVRHNLDTNLNSNFKDPKMLVYIIIIRLRLQHGYP